MRKILYVMLLSMLLILAAGCSSGGGGSSDNDDEKNTTNTNDNNTTADTTAPTTPTNLIATVVSTSQINLSWGASTDNVSEQGYKIYRGGVYLKSVTGVTASDTGLSSGRTYCYRVQAYDTAFNESSQSTESCATTTGGHYIMTKIESSNRIDGTIDHVTYYTYDANGNMTKEVGDNFVIIDFVTYYTYDANGNMTKMDEAVWVLRTENRDL